MDVILRFVVEQFNPGVIQMIRTPCQLAAAGKHMNCFSPASE